MTTHKTSAAALVSPAVPEQHPSAGGSYVRNADGSLSPAVVSPETPQAAPALTQE